MNIIRNRKNETLRTLATLICGALLLLCGLAIIKSSHSTYTDYQASQTWPQTSTVIEDLDFTKNDDQTFSLNIAYNYTFDGKTYSDKYEDFYEYDEEAAQSKYQQLKALLEQKSGWKFFVNPNNPQVNLEKIVFPDVIFLMLLVSSIFILFGLGLLFTALALLSEIKKERKRQTEFPKEPWKWNSKWQNGLIYSERQNSIPFFICMLIFWFQLSSFFIYAGYNDPLEFNIGLGIAGLMFLAGLFFIFLVIKSQLKLLKHGQSILEPLSFPGYSGSEFKALINVPFQLNPEGQILFQIDCVKHYTTHELRGKAEYRTNLFWKENFSVAKEELRYENDMTVIPFSIQIPPDLPESSEDGVMWSLEVSAKRENLNWSETFPLPIFQPKSKS